MKSYGQNCQTHTHTVRELQEEMERGESKCRMFKRYMNNKYTQITTNKRNNMKKRVIQTKLTYTLNVDDIICLHVYWYACKILNIRNDLHVT